MHPPAADGGDGVLRAVANTLNDEPLTADKVWSSGLSIERELTNPHITVVKRLIFRLL